jgi:hypothetical protein
VVDFPLVLRVNGRLVSRSTPVTYWSMTPIDHIGETVTSNDDPFA